MYGWIFRHLPGPGWLRFAQALVLVAGAVVLLFGWVFPWAVDEFGLSDPTTFG